VTPMYLDCFGLADAPFSIAPDPRYLFMSPQHREALAHLLYGVKSDDGFVVLTGEVGTGKTTVCRCLLEQLPAGCEVAVIFNPRLSVLELLATVCEEFRIPVPESDPGIKVYIDRINAWLLDVHAGGRMAVLIIDEAQSLEADVLEQVRLLTNLETNQRKLLRIILLGQPQLRDLLARPDMAQLAQRIVARYHLGPLSRPDMEAYVAHRLAAAGARRELFSAAALQRLHRLSGGVPRRVNVIADRALLGAYVQGKAQVDGATVQRAGDEVLGRPTASPARTRAAVLGLGALCGTAAGLTAYFHYEAPAPAVQAAETPKRAVAAAVVPTTLVGPAEAPPAALRTERILLAPPPPDPAPKTVRKPEVEILRQGNRGPAVEILRRELAQAQGIPLASPPSPVFDAELAEEVRRFQVAEGLPATGMVGPHTRQRLGRAVQLAGPRAEDQSQER
jgi:general secretion pathway protein A